MNDDFEMSSPMIVDLMEPPGTLKGKAAVRAYWEKGLAVLPDLKFELVDVCKGLDPRGDPLSQRCPQHNGLRDLVLQIAPPGCARHRSLCAAEVAKRDNHETREHRLDS